MLVSMEKLGCSRPVVGMVLPTGYTFNTDGTAIYLTMAAIFVAQAMNVHLTIWDQLLLLGVLLLTSKGAAEVAGAGFVALAATRRPCTRFRYPVWCFCWASIGS